VSETLKDNSLGLVLRGYDLVPNASLATKIAVYTPEVVETILTEHPEIIDQWLQKLHREYINNKKICDFEVFERNLKSWEEGGFIKIMLPVKKAIRVSKSPIFSLAK
jgi:hypothetical protein